MRISRPFHCTHQKKYSKQSMELEFSSTLRFRAVELTTLNIALLGRQPTLFLKFLFLLFNFFLIVLSLVWFSVSIRNREFLLDVCFQDLRLKVMRRIRSRNSLQKLEGVTNCTRGVCSYLGPLLNILYFGPSL